MIARPGWYRDPAGQPVMRYWDGRYWTPYTSVAVAEPPPLLDREAAAVKTIDPRAWGVRPVVLPIAAYVVGILAGFLAVQVVDPATRAGELAFATVLNVGLEAFVAVAAYVAGRDIAARAGGWGAAFGWRRPRWKDLAIALAGVGIVFGARMVIGLVTVIVAGQRTLDESQNLTVDRPDAGVVVLLVVVAGLIAPVLEEFVFRGLIFRTFLRRMSFWPAALLSSLIFAVGHTYEVDTFRGAVVLTLNVAVVGIVNCGLVRYTARLAPGIFAHAIFNLAAVLLLAAGVGPS